MDNSSYVPEGRFVPTANMRRVRMAGLRFALACAMLAVLAGFAVVPSAWGAALVDKGLMSVQALDPTTTSGVPTVKVSFEQHIGTAGLTTRTNYEVTNLATGGLFGSLQSVNPDNILPDKDDPLVYYLTWNSGEMVNSTTSNAKLTIKDLVDDQGNRLTTSLTFTFAGKAVLPTANSITCAATVANPTSSTTVPFTVSFTEPVKNVSVNNFQITVSTGLTYTGPTVTVDPSDASKFKVEFHAVTAPSPAQTGTIRLYFKTTQPTPAITDLAGNPLLNGTGTVPALSTLGTTAQIDQVPLQATTVAGTTPTNNPTFTVTFNKDVVGFDDPAADLTIFSDPSKVTYTTAIISGSGRSYTVSFVAPRGVGPISIQVKSTSDLRDARGDGLTATTNGAVATVDVDTVRPNANYLHTDNPSPTGVKDISFVVKFDKNVYDFTPSDLSVRKASGVTYGGAVITGDPQDLKNYNVKITNVAGNGTLALAVLPGDPANPGDPVSLVHDRAGNKLDTSTVSNTVVIDHTGPSATEIAVADPNPTRGGTATFFVTFNEKVQQFTVADLVFVKTGTLTYNGVSVSGFPSVPDSYFTVLVEGLSGEGSLTLSVNKGSNSKVCDVSLNPIVSSVTSVPLVVDVTPPEATKIQLLTPNPTNSDTVSFSVEFSEPVNGFTNQLDLKVIESPVGAVGHEGATITNSGDDKNYTVDVTGVYGDGTITLKADTASDITDKTGNPLESSVSSIPAAIIDNTLPKVTVTPLTKNSATPPVSLTGTVSDNIAVASVSIMVHGITYAATLGTGGAAGTWSADVTEVLAEGIYDVTATATDTAGNTAEDATNKELTMDLNPPTATVTRQITGNTTPVISGTVADNIGVSTVTFTIAGNTYNAVVAGGNWSAKVTNPLPSVKQPYDVVVTATDFGGNVGHDTTTDDLEYDPDAPSVEVNTIVTKNRRPTLTGSVLYKGTATGIESVKVSVGGQETSAVLSESGVPGKLDWTTTLLADLNDGIYDVAVTATDNAVPPRPGMDGTTNELTIDNQGPTATFTLEEGSPTPRSVLHAKLTFNEPLDQPFVDADMVLTGTLAANVKSAVVSGTDPAYTVTITMNADSVNKDGSIGVGIKPTVKDKAQNLYAGTESPAWFLHHWLGFINHPQSAPAYSNQPHTFTVEARFGDSIPVYAWKWNDGGKSITTVGSNSPVLVVDPVAGKAGSYWCEVTYGDPATYVHTYASNKATLYVAEPLQILEQPKGLTRFYGQEGLFRVVTKGGFQPLSYAWFKNDVRIADAAGAAYRIDKIETEDQGKYQVIVTDQLGTPVASDKVTLVVNGKPVPVAGLAGLAALAGACMFVGCRPKSGRKNRK